MGTISRKLGDDELPPSSEAADADLIGDHEDRGRTGNYILILYFRNFVKGCP